MKRNSPKSLGGDLASTTISVVGLRVLGILTMSSILGFAFNSGNPVGIRWNETPTVPRKGELAGLVSNQNVAATSSTTSSTVPSNSVPMVAGSYVAPSPTTWAQVKPRLAAGHLVLVDARSTSAFDAGHIPGAISLPEDSPTNVLAGFRTQYGTNTSVVAYCSSTSCSLSFKLVHKLAQEFGFQKTEYMTGGYLEYQREIGLTSPTAEVVAAGQSTTSNSSPLPLLAESSSGGAKAPTPRVPIEPDRAASPVTALEALALVRERQALWIDVRSAEEFAAGHIPGAVSSPFDGKTAPRDLLQKHSTDQPMVLYCGTTGCRSAFELATILQRDHGYRTVRFMIEGYQQWSRKNPASPNP